jgi:hypothetical protein
MLRRFLVIVSLVLIVLATVIFLALRGCGATRSTFFPDAAAHTASGRANASTPAMESAKPLISSGALANMPLAVAILDAESAIAAGGDARAILAALREKLLAADRDAASDAISAYLASGRNVATGLPFVVGKGGTMASVTSMREYLLDLLLTVDPSAALSEAEVVFDAKTSANEYAICLRNVGKLDTSAEGRAYVGKRARELLNDATLSSNPTAGFVEAFDALVYVGDVSDLKLLAVYAAKGKGAVLNMPAFLAMDRMVIDDTAAALKVFLDDATLLDDRPLTRAGFFARADLSDKTQLAEVESYVERLNPSSEEANYFFSLFPNGNFTITDSLLSDRLTLPSGYVEIRYSAALSTLDIWIGDSRFSAYASLLKSAKTRLETQTGR